MFTPIQLEAIKMFGRKDLTEGCLFYANNDSKDIVKYITNKIHIRVDDGFIIKTTDKDFISEILGHIPHLEDLFRVAEEKEKGFVMNEYSLFIFGEDISYYSDYPLLDQLNLEEIISLFK